MSEDPNFSIEWHKGFQVGLYSGKHTEQERIIKLLEEMRIRFMDNHDDDLEKVVIEAIFLILQEGETE